MHRRLQPSDLGSSLHGLTRFGRARLRYIFTIEDVRLSCGSALLQAAGVHPPTIALTWRSGKKQVFGGVTRALGPQDGAGAGAIWPRPVSLGCSLTTASKGSGQRFEPRPSEIILRIEGAKAARRKLTGTLDLATYANFERSNTRITVPLSHGAGTLQFSLSGLWIKQPVLDDADDDAMSRSSTGTADTLEESELDACMQQPTTDRSPAEPRSALTPSPVCSISPAGDSSASKPRATSSSKKLPVRRAASFEARALGSGGTAGAPKRQLQRRPSLDVAAEAPPLAASCKSAPLDGAELEHSKSQEDAAECTSHNASADSHSTSLFSILDESMEDMLNVQLALSLDEVFDSFLGMDCEQTRFGTLLCQRLGYMQVTAEEWVGNETTGQTREVHCVVKCPPKPMLPDTTRVTIKHRLVREGERMLLEREVATLDVPYGESFSLQERWQAVAEGTTACHLHVLANVHFRSRLLLHAKIKHQALKKSRKAAAVTAELLEHALRGEDGASANAGERHSQTVEVSELAQLQEKFDALLEEATFLKRHAQQLERENKRLQSASAYSRKSKRQLCQQLVAAEEALQKERRERAAMEEALTEAYSNALRQVVEQQEAAMEEAANAKRVGAKSRMRGGLVAGIR